MNLTKNHFSRWTPDVYEEWNHYSAIFHIFGYSVQININSPVKLRPELDCLSQYSKRQIYPLGM